MRLVNPPKWVGNVELEWVRTDPAFAPLLFGLKLALLAATAATALVYHARQHGQSAHLGSGRARPLRLLGARLAALGGAAFPGVEARPLGAQPRPRVLGLELA